MRYLVILFLLIAQTNSAQSLFLRDNGQQSFPESVSAGNYSGVAYLGNDDYAIVSDKSECDGFFIFHIPIDSLTGKINEVVNKGFMKSGDSNTDLEGITYNPERNKLYICSEATTTVSECSLDGRLTGLTRSLAEHFPQMPSNGGLESLTFNRHSNCLWTINENPLPMDSSNDGRRFLRLVSLDDSLCVRSSYAYAMDKPEASGEYSHYAYGVSELASLDDGRLLVMEREFFVPKTKIRAFCNCKIYIVIPDEACSCDISKPLASTSTFLAKELLYSWQTKLSLLGRSIANYEGMCVGPFLADGSRVLMLISDSQNQYKHVLKDWFRTVVIKP